METSQNHSRPTIGLLTRALEHVFESELWHGAADAAQDHDANLISFVGNDPQSPQGFDAQANVIYDFVNPEIVDGLVVCSNILTFFINFDTLKQFCDRYHPLPMVSVAAPLSGIPSIVIDNYAGMYELVTHLITVHGYHRIAFIRGPEKSLEAEDRYRAYRQALADHQIPFDAKLVTSGSFFPSSGKISLELLVKQRGLQPGEDFQALIAANDATAISALETLQVWGFRVPEEIAVAGFDNTMESRSITPSLTTVHIPVHDLAYQAVTLLLDRLRGRTGPDRLTISPTFVARQSCGCASALMRQASIETKKSCEVELSCEKTLEIRRSQILAEITLAMEGTLSTSEWARHGLLNFSPKASAKPISHKTRTEWAARLLNAFIDDLQGKSPRAFLKQFEEVLDLSALSGENVTPWREFSSILRRYALSYLQDQQQRLYAESLFCQTRVMIAERNERIQMYKYLQLEARTRMSRQVGERLMTVSTLEELKDVLYEGLPQLGILSVYLSLYDDPERPDLFSTLLLAYSEYDRRHFALEGTRFPSVQLVPKDGVLTRVECYNFVMYPLYFRTRRMGFVLFEISPREERMGQILCGQISSALMNVQHLEQIQLAREAAEIANEAKSEFLASMSHELRTPLNAILGFAGLIEDNPQIPAKEQEFLRIIHRNGDHLLMLINQVLDLSKIEAGRLTLDEKEFDLRHLIDDLHGMFFLKAQNKGLELVFERNDDLPQHICTDEVKLRQVLINVLNNAIKFTNKGGVQLSVSSSQLEGKPEQVITGNCSLNTDCCLLFTVKDSGPGIAPEEMDKLFEAFGQTETGRRAQEGTGLGLAISRKFVRLMGGDITVTSDVGEGTVVRFDIQGRVVDTIDVGKGRRTCRAIALEPGQPRYRLLIVDDKADNRKLLIKLLEPFGFELREAKNGQEAIEAWEQWQPHLIWMDLWMPVLDGYKALQHIKSSPEGRQTIVIVMSASLVNEDRIAEIAGGYDDFLRKPFLGYEVLDLLHKHLGLHFVCEEGRQDADCRGAGEEALTRAALATLPDELLMNLENAAMISDMSSMMALIENVRVLDSTIAAAFTVLAENFEFPTILAALQQRHDSFSQ